MGQGPWDADPPDPVEKEPPDFSGFVLFIIGMILLGVAGWSLMNWALPEVTEPRGPFRLIRFLHANPLIYLVLFGLILLAGQFARKK